MNKSDLKEKWGKYCDTDALVNNLFAMYRGHRHSYSEHGICTILDNFFTQKEPLIQLFETSNHYLGDMRIAVQREFDRQISNDDVYNFFNKISDKLHATEMWKKVDSNGKTIADYLFTGKKSFGMNDLPNENEQRAKRVLLNKFDRNTGATTESMDQYNNFLAYMNVFRYAPYSKLSEEVKLADDGPKLHRGTKTSRAFNAVCHHYGVDKFAPQIVTSTDADGNVTKRTTYPYDKIFAQYADLVSDLARKMYFVISVNPLDYLTMSNGVSWKSCHNIADGCYKGGTLSYMLDTTSIITFVIDNMDNPIHKMPKFYRQMIHYSNDLFMQNRLYPQGNDGATDLYAKFRNFVIEEFSELLNVDEEWTVEKGIDPCVEHANSTGKHYTDYRHNNSCNVFYPRSKKNAIADHIIQIGHEGICAKCGKPYSHAGRLSHDAYALECTVE